MKLAHGCRLVIRNPRIYGRAAAINVEGLLVESRLNMRRGLYRKIVI
jgi:hypothetical protein